MQPLLVIYAVSQYQCFHCQYNKKCFASAIRSDIDVVINWLVLLASFSFRTITPSATFQLSGMVPFLHITLRSFHSRRKSFGHLLYTLYIIPLGPRADRDLALLTTSKTSFKVGSLKSKVLLVVLLAMPLIILPMDHSLAIGVLRALLSLPF